MAYRMSTFRVFVYGTLKNGEPNSHVLTNPKTGTHQFVGNAVTKDAYPLFVAGKWNVPFLLAEEGQGFCIHGELYDVNETKLKALDRLEGHPNVYERKQCQVVDADKNDQLAWIYMLKKYDTRLDATKTKLIDRYYNGVEGRAFIKHEFIVSTDNLV